MNLHRSLRDLAKTILARARTPLAGVFDTYEKAVQACLPDGYGSLDLVNEIARKTKLFYREVSEDLAPTVAPSQALLAAGLEFVARQNRRLSIIDFGGACGVHALLSRRILEPSTEISWHVVETEAMVEAASRIGLPQWLHFHCSLEQARNAMGQPDLIYANNSLQYSSDPLAIVAELIDANPSILCLGRLAHRAVGPVVYTVQTSRLVNNGPGANSRASDDRTVRYAMTLCGMPDYHSVYVDRYRELLRLDDPEVLALPGVGLVRYANVLLRRR
jgi:putative methyltransferase (TIGR04325 family)